MKYNVGDYVRVKTFITDAEDFYQSRIERIQFQGAMVVSCRTGGRLWANIDWLEPLSPIEIAQIRLSINT